MVTKPTVIGGGKVPKHAGPTVIGGSPTVVSTAAPTVIKPSAPQASQPGVAAPTRIGGAAPTRIGGAAPAAATPATPRAPSVMKDPSPVLSLGAIAAKVQQTVGSNVVNAVATVLPGSVRRYLDVSPEELKAKFPEANAYELENVRQLLSDEPYTTWEASDWLSFGREAQEKVSICIKDRLKYMENNDLRATSRHLLRMNAIFTEVLTAFNDKGFFAKSPLKAWEQSRGEVQQLEKLLGNCHVSIDKVLKGLNSLRRAEEAADATLKVHIRALQVLSESIDPSKGNLIIGRRDALITSQAMLLEHTLSRELDEVAVSALMERVNDGVLVYLPSLYTTLARIPDKSTATDKFMFVESITTLQEKLKV